MQKKKGVLPVFIFLFVLSIALLALSGTGALRGLTGFLETVTIPLQGSVFGVIRSPQKDSVELAKLREENSKLVSQLASQKNMEQEIAALRNQFQATHPSSRVLLPATVIGTSGDKLVIDKGRIDSVHTGDVVVVSDNLIGQVDRVSERLSLVSLIIREDVSFTAKTVNTNSLGVIKGQNGGLVIDNVVLTDKLEKGDLVVTKGDVDEEGDGFIPNLVVGRITTVNKKASNLFQSAEVESLVDFGRLEMVFVIVRND
jgi:rod shape-determining protein MreC